MPRIAPLELLSIGDLARRAGVSEPTVRYCEQRRLIALQSSLDGCIGCGCLSLGTCTLFNPGDEAALEGPGSRWLRKADSAATEE